MFLLLVFSISFKALTNCNAEIYFMRQYSLGKRLIEGYLHQPFSWFLNRNSADLGKNIISEAGHVVNQALNPSLELIQNILVTLALLIILISVDLNIAIIAGLTLGLVYGIIFFFTRSIVFNIGKERLKATESLFISVSEAFGAIKEIKVVDPEKILLIDFILQKILQSSSFIRFNKYFTSFCT